MPSKHPNWKTEFGNYCGGFFFTFIFIYLIFNYITIKDSQQQQHTTQPKTESQLMVLNKKELVQRCLNLQNDNTLLKSMLLNLEDKVSILTIAVDEIRKSQATASTTSTESNPAVEKRMIALEKDNFSCQQYSRRDTVEIAGFPTDIADVELEAKACDLFGEIGVNIAPSQIQACHRLYDKKRVIIKFMNRKSAIEILRSRSKLKDIDLKNIGININRLYINESLCPPYRMLHGKLKTLYKRNIIHSFWVWNGTIKYKMNEHDNPTTVFHLNDLTEVFGDVIDETTDKL